MKTEELINQDLVDMISQINKLQEMIDNFQYSSKMKSLESYYKNLTDLSNDLGDAKYSIGYMIAEYMVNNINEGSRKG